MNQPTGIMRPQPRIGEGSRKLVGGGVMTSASGDRWIIFLPDGGDVIPFNVTGIVTDAQWTWLRRKPRNCTDAEWLQCGLTGYTTQGALCPSDQWSSDDHRSGEGEWVMVYDG